MKKFLNLFSFIFKAFLLVILLLLGWVFINVTNLVKGKRSVKNTDTAGLWGTDKANADVPPSCTPSCTPTTPFIAYYDGNDYKLENDILYGRPTGFHPQYEMARQMYEDGKISSDLYKIKAPINSVGNKIKFQIQEIEPEESFFKWLELIRVAHPKNTKLIVDSEHQKYYLADKAEFEEKIILPESVKKSIKKEINNNSNWNIVDKKLVWDNNVANNSIFFDNGDFIDIDFSGAEYGKTLHLAVKSWFRNWTPGLEATKSRWSVLIRNLTNSLYAEKGAVALALLAGIFLHKRVAGSGTLLSFVSFMIGSGSMCPCPPPCSFEYQYRGANGEYHTAAICGVRWSHNLEIIELPKEAVQKNGKASIRIVATKKHALGFVGLIKNLESLKRVDHKEENLHLCFARHNRLGKDMTVLLSEKNSKGYAHTIPGDTIDLEFEAPKTALAKNEKETYLLRSSGFYTSLRPEYAKIAGNWQEKISSEAKKISASFIELKDYF